MTHNRNFGVSAFKKSKFLPLVLFAFCSYAYASALEISAVGDVYLSKRIIDQQAGDFLGIPLSGDIVFANFEGVLSANPKRDDALRLKLTMPMEAEDVLKKIGINTLSLANNHSLDLGPTSYSNTFSKMAHDGFHVAGLNDEGTVFRINGLTIRFIAFSFSGNNNVCNPKEAANLIRSFKEDIIIVSAHMGGENRKAYLIPGEMEYYGSDKRGDVIRFAHACIDAGADLIIGHGPHILRGVELYKNKFIAYSLGNFIFDFPGAEKSGRTPACSMSISLAQDGSFRAAKINSYTLKFGAPVPDKKNRASKIISHLTANNLACHDLIFDKDGDIRPKGEER